MTAVLSVMATLVLCPHLWFVDGCNHVDTIVYDVGDGGVDLTVQSQQTQVTQVNFSEGLCACVCVCVGNSP